ncbi:MAG: hypothetical protein B7Z74_09715, partial [Deltaproteobacteria bacterium 21-66-5]
RHTVEVLLQDHDVYITDWHNARDIPVEAGVFGFDEYVEGEGKRAEYDSKNATVELFGNAYVKRGQDIVTGNYISYDSNTEFFQSVGGAKSPTGRVHAVIQPKKKEGQNASAPAPASPAMIRPSETLASPPQQ